MSGNKEHRPNGAAAPWGAPPKAAPLCSLFLFIDSFILWKFMDVPYIFLVYFIYIYIYLYINFCSSPQRLGGAFGARLARKSARSCEITPNTEASKSSYFTMFSAWYASKTRVFFAANAENAWKWVPFWACELKMLQNGFRETKK